MQPEVHAEAADGATRGWLLQQAQLLDAAVGGSVAVNDQGRFFNRFMLATPQGDLHQYDKRHLFRMGGEHRHYSAGGRAQIFEWRGIRLCPLVCYDLRFPVWSRRRAQLEYDLLTYSRELAGGAPPRVDDAAARPRHRKPGLRRGRESRRRTTAPGWRMRATAWSWTSPASRWPSSTTAPASPPSTLDLAALRAWRDKFPAHLDADAFILES